MKLMQIARSLASGTRSTLLVITVCLGLSGTVFGEAPSLATLGKGLLHGATIMHQALAQLGHEAEVKVFYVPDQGGFVHLKDDPGVPDTGYHIRLEANVQFLFDWENQLPADSVRKLAGFGMPKPGPVADVPVRWYFPENLVKYTELHADDWVGVLPTWWNKTDAQGVATAHLYLLPDQPLGGVKKIEEGQVRVVAKIQQGIPLNPAKLGLGIGEELFTPTEAFVLIKIERHDPTEWEGEVTIERTLSSIAKAQYISGSQTEDVLETNMWDATMNITNVRLQKDGTGSGDYSFQVWGNFDRRDVTVNQGVCEVDGPPQTFTEIVEITRSGFGKESGTVPITLRVDPRGPRYALNLPVFATGEALVSGYSGDGRSNTKWNDCQGSHSSNSDVDPTPPSWVMRAYQIAYQVPRAEWPTFDPDAPALNGYTQWNTTFESDNGVITYTLTTTMRWNLKRIYE